VYTATLRGVREEVKPRLAPWKVENFTEEEIDKVTTTTTTLASRCYAPPTCPPVHRPLTPDVHSFNFHVQMIENEGKPKVKAPAEGEKEKADLS
jgi:hypothetical protein